MTFDQRDKNTKMHIKAKVLTFSYLLDTFQCIHWFISFHWMKMTYANGSIFIMPYQLMLWIIECILFRILLLNSLFPQPLHMLHNINIHFFIHFSSLCVWEWGVCVKILSGCVYYDKWISYLILFYFVFCCVDIVLSSTW